MQSPPLPGAAIPPHKPTHRRGPAPCRCAPLVGALAAAARADAACFHFPGHRRGEAAPPSLSSLLGPSVFSHDLPELTELDDLFSPAGPLLRAQHLAAALFGAEDTFFLVGGSTSGVQAAVMATCSPGETLILPRHAHLSAFSAMVLSGALPRYLPPSHDPSWSVPLGATADHVAAALRAAATAGERVSAVLLTSPTYHGLCSDVRAAAELCHAARVPLLVDEAHGAHFRFHERFPRAAMDQGADLAVQSTHKVLTSLTQSSMLHARTRLVDRDRLRRCLQALQSSSPSFLLLASLDAARAQLRPGVFDEAVRLADHAKARIAGIPGVDLLDGLGEMDPLRVTVGVWRLGMTGYEADEELERAHGVRSELAGARSVTFAVNLGTRRGDVERLVEGLRWVAGARRGCGGGSEMGSGMAVGRAALSPREAFFARKKTVGVRESRGRVCGEMVCTYPPGIPVLVPGEEITVEAVEFLLMAKEKGAAISGAADRTLSTIVVCDC
ncbi:uncharacterized protein LOC144711476 [Wolffia australiana]